MKPCVGALAAALALSASAEPARPPGPDSGGLDLGAIDPKLVSEGLKLLRTAESRGVTVDREAVGRGASLLFDALRISANAEARRLRHEARLSALGISEVPASRAAVRYAVDTHGLGDLLFDDWGELFIDRRFLSADELKRVREVEDFAWKHIIEPLQGAKVLPAAGAADGASGRNPVKRAPRAHAGAEGLPVFRGFEDARYQAHDALIARLTAEFNADKAKGCGGTAAQAAKVADVSPALVKAHMIEEAGGNGPRSKAAWAVDPLQVNVPGDWGAEKALVGLSKPSKRNEGTVEQNVRAAIMYLSRKGFSVAARPAAERPKGFFDGWLTALRRYNGRRDRTDSDRYYSEEYADKIVRRANNPDLFVPIGIRLAR